MPNRVIKESIRTSKTVNELSDFQFRLWVYLITYVDDYGRGSADPELLKGFVFPRRKRVSETDIQKALAELAGIGCINLYNVDGESYFYFPNWSDHQRIQTKKPKFPDPFDDAVSPWVTVGHGGPPPESNPIQSESISEIESESKSMFGQFWTAYPKKKAKADAEKAWRSKDVNGDKHIDIILAAIARQRQSPDWQKDGGKYIPHPASWLRGRRWEDSDDVDGKERMSDLDGLF